MYLAIALVDYLDLKGNLQTTKVISNQNNRNGSVNNLEDIFPGGNKESLPGTGSPGAHLLSNCKVRTTEEHASYFQSEQDMIEFKFDHTEVPLLPVYDYTMGLYNLILPVNFALTELSISTPAAELNGDTVEQEPFQYSILWDKHYRTQLVRMELRSEKGSVSFTVKGKARLALQDDPVPPLKSTKISEDIIKNIDLWGFDQQAKEIVLHDLEQKIDWLKVKPNFFGLALNYYQIIRDATDLLKARLQQRG
jgi:hypothetical protein